MESIVTDGEIHTLIVWSKAIDHIDAVEGKIREKFNLLANIEIAWEKEKFLDNLHPFYAHSQKHLGAEAYKDLLVGKIEHCGDEPFQLFVFKDQKPEYAYRETSSGLRSVNINIFDLKAELRMLTEGGHKIHASDNTFESNKDLTILLGQNTEDFLQNLEDWRKVKKITTNCLGVGGFTNITELFYLLNNSIDYVVLRNFDCLPDEYTLEGHGDIDLLVENLNYILYLTGAKAVFPNEKYRVHHIIKINGTEIPFDFRYVGDNYYDRKWQEDILYNKAAHHSLIPVPNPVNHFFSLLYHAYVHKFEVSTDYHGRLHGLGEETGVHYSAQMTKQEVKELLDNFLDKKQYRYSVPVDRSVFYNTDFLSLGTKPGEYGKLISTQVARLGDKSLITEVFYDAEKNRIYKICPEPIASNEIRGLTLLNDTGVAPKLLGITRKDEVTVIEMEYLEGVPLSELFKDGNFWKFRHIKKLINDTVKILEVLISKDILHRDIKPDNFLIQKVGNFYELKIIDFGWSCKYGCNDAITPQDLGEVWKRDNQSYSDIHSSYMVLNELLFRLPTITAFISRLLNDIDAKHNKIIAVDKLRKLYKNTLPLRISQREQLFLFFKRNYRRVTFYK